MALLAPTEALAAASCVVRRGVFPRTREQILRQEPFGGARLPKADRILAVARGRPVGLLSGQAFQLQVPVELAHDLRIVAPITQDFHE
jgi:hypothetical protein